mmetsp:Transcript_20541/g.30098  ORF Transcript_20541/g.30098 Transcript_20541/m.30098 type:complete len:90 (-) Transcript_20541:21-290(-)
MIRMMVCLTQCQMAKTEDMGKCNVPNLGLKLFPDVLGCFGCVLAWCIVVCWIGIGMSTFGMVLLCPISSNVATALSFCAVIIKIYKKLT